MVDKSILQDDSYAITTRGLRKSFRVGKETVDAVRGVDLGVPPGLIYGFLGPNGAGKSTTLRMLTTLLPIDGGEARVAGADVVASPAEVRRRIGYVAQRGGADLAATGYENLLLQARLYGMDAAAARRHAAELADLFQLGEFLARPARTYSGGQRRRLELALAMMHRPPVLFLDEPTTGLDPQNRALLWDMLRELRDSGTTVFLVTHYLDEADTLADRLAIIDHGEVVAEGTPHELKRRVAGDAIVVEPEPETGGPAWLARALSEEPYVRDVRAEGAAVRLYVADGPAALPALVERLRALQVPLRGVSLAAASLDDVFLQQTGRSLRDAGDPTRKAVAA